jgi:tetratricopeptide (TPR) repeat protein
MKPEDRIKGLIRQSDVVTGAGSDKRILGDAFERLEEIGRRSRAETQPGIWSTIGKLAVAAVIAIAVIIGIYQVAAPGVAWADVAERFRTVPFFSASIYFKEDATSEPQQMELWMNRTGKIRMRLGTQVIFGDRGDIVESFDIKTRARVEPDERAIVFLRKIGEADEFSLDAIIRIMFGGTMQDVTPLVNPDAVISKDMVVFDVEIPWTPEWVRIWALRESRLPVRIRIWDPRDGDSTDAIFEYSREQADEFFDPNAFENLLKTERTSSRVSLAYAFLEDPGGKKITPEEMFDESGYHMPIITQAGITPEGAVWITAGKGRNRTPNGNPFDGFSRIEDDLGRTYFSIGGGHRTKDDTSYDIFVPIDFPFDDRTPSKITLFCEVEDYNPNTEPELVGTVDLTEWEQNAPFPDLFGTSYRDMLNLKIWLAYKLFGSENAERLNRLVQTIPDWSEQPENKSLLFFRIRLAYQEKDDEEVIKIGEVLAPLIFETPDRESRYGFREYLIALARTGRIDEAAELFRKIDAVDEMSPEKSNERYYPRFLQFIAEFLASDAELTTGQISEILGFDISQRKEYKFVLERAERTAANRKAKELAERRLKEISDYYQTHPLPERMELLERPNHEAIHLIGVSNVLPGHEDYKVLPINYPISGLVTSLRYYSDILPYDIAPIRIEDNAAEQKLLVDLIYRDGITHRQRAEYVLGLFGMELLVEEGASRTVLVARYDGRPLRNFKDVKAPLRHDPDSKSKVGMTKSSASAGIPMRNLLNGLVIDQNRDIKDDSKKLIIVNETGIEGNISSESAFWPGDEGFKLAKEWFKENFGVTFTEDVRTMTTYVIRKRKEGQAK